MLENGAAARDGAHASSHPSADPESSAEPRSPHHPRAASIPTITDSNWYRFFARGLVITDLVSLVIVVFGTQLAWLGTHQFIQAAGRPEVQIQYWIASGALVLLWMAALAINDTRSPRVVGTGFDEYKRIFDASFILFGCIAIGAYLMRWQVARGFLLIALPAGIALLFLTRWLWRQWLASKRQRGAFSHRVLLVGSQRTATHVARELARIPRAGYRVVGACLPTARVGGYLGDTDIPVMGNVDAIAEAIARTQADTVMVTSTDELPAQRVKQISWELEKINGDLVMAPSLIDVAGPRLHKRPVAGLPLIHVEVPSFSAGPRFVKRMADLFTSLLLITLLSPLLLLLALLVKLTSPGPVIFQQERVGYRGRRFRMLKFRSMVVDAEERLAELRNEDDESVGNSVMFKMRDDPRVTRIGRVMRRYSLDELPQLFNVLGGSMSLVGPRPSLPREAELYAEHVHRRFLVKPGITGLWQVSGRSTLSWEDTVRLDLSYVENWSLFGDFLILLKTGRAALAPGETAA